MTASDTVPVVVAAAIGAGGVVGGAVITQITWVVFTARRERTRLDWDTDRQEREWKMRKEERFLHLKQELYSNFIRVVDQYLLAVSSVISDPDKYEDEFKLLPSPRELQRIDANIQLIAPSDVQDAATYCYMAILEVALHVKRMNDDVRPLAVKAQRARSDVQLAFERDLQGEREVVKHVRGITVPSPSPEESREWWRRKLNEEHHPLLPAYVGPRRAASPVFSPSRVG